MLLITDHATSPSPTALPQITHHTASKQEAESLPAGDYVKFNNVLGLL